MTLRPDHQYLARLDELPWDPLHARSEPEECASISVGEHLHPLLRLQRGSGSRRAIDPGREHNFPPVRVLVGNAAVGLPVIDLRDRLRRVPQPDDLQVNRAAGQVKDRPVPAVAVSARAPASSEAGPEGSGSRITLGPFSA